MFVITLAPLTALPQPSDQLLHYFSKEKVLPGQLVEISLNKRTLFGVVFTCNAVNAMRIAIKNSPYPLKNISSVKSSAPLLSQTQLQLALWISSYYYASLGVVLQAMLRPLGIKSTSKKIPAFNAHPYSLRGLPGSPRRDRQHFTPPSAKLLVGNMSTKEYRDVIDFISPATKKQILFLAPERKDIEGYEKIIREASPTTDIRIFHAGMKLTQQRTIARDALAGTSMVVIGTRSALLLPFRNLGTIIVENPSDPSHTSWDQNPHLNASRAAIWLHQHGFVSVVFHEEQPSVELMHYSRLNNWNIQLAQQKNFPKGILVDMRQELKDGNRSIINKDLQKSITKAKENKEPIFLFVQRRGFASGVVCRDCGFIVLCPSCSVPMVYHDQGSNSAERDFRKFLLCHRCKAKKNAPTVCPSCRGSRIRFIGAGTERVEDEVKNLFPDLSVCRLDSDAGYSSEFLTELHESLVQGKCAYNIIVGTHFAWNIIPVKSVDVAAVVTIDGLLSLPDYRSQERVYGIIEKIKKITRREYLIQTYCPDAPVYACAIAGEWDAFAKKELGLRKILKWPPYVQIIRMQYAHAQASIAQTQAQQGLRLLQAQIKSLQHSRGLPGSPRESDIFAQCEILGPSPAFVDKIKNKYVWNLVLKWPVDEKGEPQNLELRNRLLAVLPRGWDIDVDPVDLV